MNLHEELYKAGIVFDGHVTNGSLEEQVKVVFRLLDEFVRDVKNELVVAGDFGIFRDQEYIKDEHLEKVPYPERVAIEVLNKVRDKYVQNL